MVLSKIGISWRSIGNIAYFDTFAVILVGNELLSVSTMSDLYFLEDHHFLLVTDSRCDDELVSTRFP